MATDPQTRKTSSKSDAYLQREFADLCARVQRVDLVTHLLALTLIVLGYALIVGLFDWFAASSTAASIQATRTITYVVFVGLLGFLLVQSVRCWLRRVNPYYVAHQLEQTLPDGKNSLINWLDMHDEEMPAAFQKTLSAHALEQLKESDTEQPIRKRKNWILLGVHAAPLLGLLILLVLGPSALAASMLRAFLPFYTPAEVARTQITLLQPEGGDAEVSPTQSIRFAVKIEGRGGAVPRLSYRYQASEDYLTQSLQHDDAGVWTTQLQPAQLRTGFAYKISAGDVETPEYQVRVRARTHVQKFALTYQPRPFRNLPKRTIEFPTGTKPIIRGLRGTEVELVIHASRPVQMATVQIVTKAGKKELPIRKLAGDSFACAWTLDEPGQFRVAFTATDGEENSDRAWHAIDVPEDALPKVVLTQPGKDISLPEKDTLELEGEASSPNGVKSLTLHMRVIEGPRKPKLAPIVYRAGKSFQHDGVYPDSLSYLEVVPLDQLKDDKGISLAAPTVIEYWLEATDGADYPSLDGNTGKSQVYKFTITPALKNPKPQQAKHNGALNRQKDHQRKQDGDLGQQSKDRNQNPPGGTDDPQAQLDPLRKDKEQTEKKLKQELEAKEKNDQAGATKSAEQQNSAAKEGPPNSPDAPPPQKENPSTPPADAGKPKDQGEGQGATGQSKGNGAEEKKPQEGDSKGDRKDGPKDSGSSAKDAGPTAKPGPSGGVKDAGPMSLDTPMPQTKEQAGDDGTPMPMAKQGPKSDEPAQGDIKGIEKNGPDVPNNDAKTGATPPPNALTKGGTMNDASGEAKQGPADPAKQPGHARDDEPKAGSKEPSWDEIARMIERLPQRDADAAQAGKDLADAAKNSDDPRKRDLAKEALEKNDRDPKTGQEQKKKSPNRFGSDGKSPGISDELKSAVANREFSARIGQMQLDDWKKRMTPQFLKKAGLSETAWQRYLKTRQTYDALVSQLNAKLLRDALKKELRGGTNPDGALREIQGGARSNDPLGAGHAPPPPELIDPVERFSKRRTNP